MRKILQKAVFAVLVVFVFSASASVNPSQIIRKGTKLVYDVNYSGFRYEFTIVIKDQTDAYSFDWTLGSPINKKGSINVSKAAIQNANGLFNYFANGDINNLADQCCVVLSKKMFDAFKSNNTIEIFTDKKNNELSVFGNAYSHTQTFGYNNDYSNEFDCKTVTNGSDYQITYVDDPNFPLIIEMNLGWSMKLKSIFN
ncbi:MAG: hypothetical protein JWN78_2202 [Bacteroidota bacterium]|nr:hypothetical protein [Bacteroidota bacterium]